MPRVPSGLATGSDAKYRTVTADLLVQQWDIHGVEPLELDDDVAAPGLAADCLQVDPRRLDATGFPLVGQTVQVVIEEASVVPRPVERRNGSRLPGRLRGRGERPLADEVIHAVAVDIGR